MPADTDADAAVEVAAGPRRRAGTIIAAPTRDTKMAKTEVFMV